MAALSFFSPPKTISCSCMSVERQYLMKFGAESIGRTRLVPPRQPDCRTQQPIGPWVMLRMSRVGPITTPLQPA